MSNSNENIDKHKLVVRCGLWCGSCRAYLLEKKDLFKQKGYQRGCKGCWIQNKNCAFLKKGCAALENNEIAFCYECEDFPCAKLQKLDSTYKTRYKIDLVENLRRLEEVGKDNWIENKKRCINVQNVEGRYVSMILNVLIVL
ncbi:MAG: hypothetical protein BAJALOKI1v1_30039 [Promethearchaeota archaeon]|nr:MAG: hypothetical protein BAJALOKI1v1_30039 [Candidatus Lokiarchaeota archaeon]